MAQSENQPGGRPARIARVERIFDHNRDTRSLFLAPEGGAPLKYLPGQFISISIPLGDEVRTRPYTIASRPEDGNPFEICFNLVAAGRGAAWMYDRAVGDTLAFTGPFGTFTMERTSGAEILFIAEGTAVAAVRPMIHRAAGAGDHPRMMLLNGARDHEHLLYHAEFDDLARRDPGFAFETLVASDAEIYERLRAEVERRWVRADANRTRQFYVCGIGAGVIALRDLLRGAGYERRAVHYERW
jgi:phenol/toluene 2-monooxygenase (NADH) P5/A5